MNDDLAISDPVPVVGSFLPYNYLPAAFRQLVSPEDNINRIIFILTGSSEQPRARIQYHIVSAKTLSEPDALAKFLSARGFSDNDAFRRCFLGPPTQLEETSPEDAPTLAFDRIKLADPEEFEQVAVIIDIGIAFWNQRFRAAKGSRFRAMRYLDFGAFAAGQSPFEGLGEADIDALCTLSDTPDGSAKVVAALGQQFPGSYFGRGGGAVPDTMWHGTATADLMAGLAPGTEDRTALFGIEVPMAVLRDADGDNLTTVLTLLIEAALEMTADLADKPLIIMMPWGFSAGPQDGTHPAAEAIQLALAARGGRKVTLLLPAGNHLQDRCCAHLLPSDRPKREEVVWHLPPDDFSQNTVEMLVTPSVPPAPSGVQTVRISPPFGASFVVAIKEGHQAVIWRGGQIIGILLRFRDIASGPRLRLTFAPTGWRVPGRRPTPAGNWTLSFSRTDDVSIWVLRDDRDRMLDGPFPRRASFFDDLAYRERDALGDYVLTDDPGAVVVRSGTVSVLATTAAPRAVAVQANEQFITRAEAQAWYSGRRGDGAAIATTEIVDSERRGSGVLASANGTWQRERITGTSAGVALHARRLLGLPIPPS
jgi:hypothetical protein